MLALIVLTIVCIVTYTFEIVFGLAGTVILLTVLTWLYDAKTLVIYSAMPQILVASIGLLRSPRTVRLEVLAGMLVFAGMGAVAGLYLFYQFPLPLFQLLLAATISVFGIHLVVSPNRFRIEVLPNGLDLQDYQNIKVSRRPNHIIFSGSFSYIANYEAMQWFISRVFPLIIKKIPEVQLIITGDHANLPLPSMENVVLAGYVEDIKSLLASCDVSIAPIWSGGGTRLKILEAMALGTPVIATSKGAEGLMAQDGTHLLIADDPEKFAGYVIRLIQDEALRRKLASNAAQLVKDHYDWQ